MGAVRICRASVMKQCTQGLGETVHTRFLGKTVEKKQVDAEAAQPASS